MDGSGVFYCLYNISIFCQTVITHVMHLHKNVLTYIEKCLINLQKCHANSRLIIRSY